MTMVFGYAPNKLAVQVAPGGTTWFVISTDGAAYANLAALFAAGKQPFPRSNGTNGLDPGMFLQSLTLSTTNGGADGSGFYMATNSATPPANGEWVSGSGQKFVEPGAIYNVWVKLSVAGDTLDLLGQY